MSQPPDGNREQRSLDVTQLLEMLSRLIRTSRAAGHRQQSEFGLSGTPLGILKALATGDSRLGDLALRLQIAPSVVSRAVAPLEQSGLVERRTDPDDARASRLGLTPAGRRRLDEARQDLGDRFAPLLDNWDPTDIRTLARLMGELEETICVGLDLRGHGGRELGTPAPALSTAS